MWVDMDMLTAKISSASNYPREFLLLIVQIHHDLINISGLAFSNAVILQFSLLIFFVHYFWLYSLLYLFRTDENVEVDVSRDDIKLLHKLHSRLDYYSAFRAEWSNKQGKCVPVLAKFLKRMYIAVITDMTDFFFFQNCVI